MPAGRGMPEIVIKTDDSMHFSLGNIEGVGEQGDGRVVHVAEFLL